MLLLRADAPAGTMPISPPLPEAVEPAFRVVLQQEAANMGVLDHQLLVKVVEAARKDEEAAEAPCVVARIGCSEIVAPTGKVLSVIVEGLTRRLNVGVRDNERIRLISREER